MVPNYLFRLRARGAMKPVMQVLVLAALISMLPSLICSTAISLTGSDPTSVLLPVMNRMQAFVTEEMPRVEELTQQLSVPQETAGVAAPPTAAPDASQPPAPTAQVTAAPGTVATPAPVDPQTRQEAAAEVLSIAAEADSLLTELEDAATSFWNDKGAIYLGLSAVDFVLSPALRLGLLFVLLLALTNRSFSAMTVLCRMRCLFKALGLNVLIALRTVLVMLPGALLAVLSAFLPAFIASLASTAGLILMLVMGLRAYYRFGMAPFFMAEKPETGVLDCIRLSSRLMQNRKMELFSLEISFLGWYLLEMLVETLASAIFGPIISMAVGMMLILLLEVYMLTSKGVFYLVYGYGRPQTAAQAQAAQDDLTEK